MKKILFDIECFINFFCVGFKDFNTKEITFFEISEERNDIHLIYKWFIEYNGFLIGFNSIHYDNIVIKYLITQYEQYKNLEWSNITSDLKYFSDKLINDQYDDKDIQNVRFMKLGWTDIDLYLYWAKMLRISKKISLKALGIQLGYHTIQELPFKPNTILKLEDLPKLRYYNYTHDLGILELLLSDMEGEVKLRSNINKLYGLDCWSWDAPKIASEALLQDYCKKTNQNPYAVRKQKFFRNTIYLNECLKGFDPKFELPIFQKLWKDILASKDSFSKEILVSVNNTNIRLTYGVGGLHSVNENEKYYTTDEMQVVTSDIASLYPNLIINYLCIRFREVLERYIEIKGERLIAKKNKDKIKDLFLKLILNGISGLIDQEHSWLYFPEGAMRLRLIGQLFLTKCIETCILNNFQVVSANTDGIEVLVPKDQLQNYENILNSVAESFDLDFEHEYYNFIVYKNVNNYICQTEKGKIKRKGLFLLPFDENNFREIPLGNSVDELVINKALHNYYVNGIKPEEFISNPEKYNLEIYDYCKSNKISKDFTVYHNGKVQQQLNRYYFSKHAPYLYKRKHDVGTMQHVNVGQGVELLNNYVKKEWKDYNINYNYYIRKANEIIGSIDNYNQLTLF